jgi:hypothetical protein
MTSDQKTKETMHNWIQWFIKDWLMIFIIAIAIGIIYKPVGGLAFLLGSLFRSSVD